MRSTSAQPHCLGVIAIAALVALSPLTAAAGKQPAPRRQRCRPAPRPNTHRAAECPQIFGREREHEANQRRRVQTLHGFEPRPFAVDVVYSPPWHDPVPTQLRGVELVETDTDTCGPMAVLSLDAGVFGSDCGGRFAVRVDDNIGEALHVLAIADGLVLLEADGELRYLTTNTDAHTVFRMYWRAPFRLPAARSKAVVTSTPARPTPGRK